MTPLIGIAGSLVDGSKLSGSENAGSLPQASLFSRDLSIIGPEARPSNAMGESMLVHEYSRADITMCQSQIDRRADNEEGAERPEYKAYGPVQRWKS